MRQMVGADLRSKHIYSLQVYGMEVIITWFAMEGFLDGEELHCADVP